MVRMRPVLAVVQRSRSGLPRRAERLQEADSVLDAAVHQFQKSGYQVLHAGCLQVAFEGLAALPALEDDEGARFSLDLVSLAVDVARVVA